MPVLVKGVALTSVVFERLIDVHIGVDVPSSGLRMCTSH